MAAPAYFAADEGSLVPEFFDEAHTSSGWSEAAISEEVKSLAGPEVPDKAALVSEVAEPGEEPLSDVDSEASSDRLQPEPTEAEDSSLSLTSDFCFLAASAMKHNSEGSASAFHAAMSCSWTRISALQARCSPSVRGMR